MNLLVYYPFSLFLDTIFTIDMEEEWRYAPAVPPPENFSSLAQSMEIQEKYERDRKVMLANEFRKFTPKAQLHWKEEDAVRKALNFYFFPKVDLDLSYCDLWIPEEAWSFFDLWIKEKPGMQSDYKSLKSRLPGHYLVNYEKMASDLMTIDDLKELYIKDFLSFFCRMKL